MQVNVVPEWNMFKEWKKKKLLNKNFLLLSSQSATNSFLPILISQIVIFYTSAVPVMLQLVLTEMLSFLP